MGNRKVDYKGPFNAYMGTPKVCRLFTMLLDSALRFDTFFYMHHFRSDNALDPNTDILDTIKRLQYLRPAYELREKWCYSNIVRVLPIPPAEFAK